MALVSVLIQHIYKPKDESELHDFMRIFVWLKFKMKLSYEFYSQRLEMNEVVTNAIHKTVEENCNVARSELQIFLDSYHFSKREYLMTVIAKSLIKLEDGLPPNHLTA